MTLKKEVEGQISSCSYISKYKICKVLCVNYFLSYFLSMYKRNPCSGGIVTFIQGQNH